MQTLKNLKRNQITAIILAAGKSSRLRRPKQLIPFRGVCLIRYVTQVAIFSQVERVMVVLGAFQLRIRKEVQFLDAAVVRSIFWYRGMGATIKCGVSNAVDEDPELKGFLLMLCDQPLISEDYLDKMLMEFRKGSKKIIASRYAQTIGVPALIHRDYYDELMSLDDKSGIKDFLRVHIDDTMLLEFQAGEIDVDTPSDVVKLSALPAES